VGEEIGQIGLNLKFLGFAIVGPLVVLIPLGCRITQWGSRK